MEQDPEQRIDPHASAPSALLHRFRILGPGLITGASDDDPSGIGTYSQAGAAFGFSLNWLMLFSFPLMCAVQIASARLGRTTGKGIATNLVEHYPAWLLQLVVVLLVVANVINIGADLGAMADAIRLVVGGPQLVYVVGFGVITISLEIFLPYKRYAVVLRWMTISLLAYVAELAYVKIDWSAAAEGLIPRLDWDRAYVTTLVAVLGTTISPYLFIWQADEEVEEMRAYPLRRPIYEAPDQAPAAIRRINFDTVLGMGLAHFTAIAIVFVTAATLHVHGITDIRTSADAAAALRPIAGESAATIFALGIVGTGLLAVPVLAGSAAYAVGEALRWQVGLDRSASSAKAFYGVIAVATLIGIAINISPIDPVRALFWAAVVNGVAAVPILAAVMLMVRRRDIMGEWPLGIRLQTLGWLTTFVMGMSVIGMVVLSF